MLTIDQLESHEAFRRLPAPFQSLLAAELQAGNNIVEVTYGFPAPPIGACFRLARAISTSVGDLPRGLSYYARNSSLYAGEITDDQRHFFILEPPRQETEQQPTAGGAREQNSATAPVARQVGPPPAPPRDNDLVNRFRESMVMSYDKWHDGIGYETELITQMNSAERSAVEALILNRKELQWYDVEALALLQTPKSRVRLLRAWRDGDHLTRHAVERYMPELISREERITWLVKAIGESDLISGLSQILDYAAGFHPPEVVAAMHQAVMARDGQSACLIAGLLLYIYGATAETFDFNERPFLLRFNTEDGAQRSAAYAELCRRVENRKTRNEST